MGTIWPIELKADLTPLCQALADILRSGHKGVCKLAEAFFGRAVNEKLRSSLLIAAQNEADAKAIVENRKIYDSGVLMDVVESDKDGGILQFVAQQSQIDEARCLLLSLKDAAKKLEERREADISDAPISQTFFNRWRKEVELVDDDELRDLWSRVLVEEICRPNSIALQTLEAVRRISKEEAMSFQRILKGSINECIPKNLEGHVQYGSYADILALQDIGLIQTAGMTTQTYNGNLNIFGRQGCAVVFVTDCPYAFIVGGGYRVNCYTLSRAGKDLSKIALLPRNVKDVVSVAEYLLSTNPPSTELSIHLVLSAANRGSSIVPNYIWSSKRSPTDTQEGIVKS